MFDAQQYLEALERPQFIAPNGKRYVGQILSVDQWTPLEKDLREAAKSGGGPKMYQLMRQLVRSFFPHPWWKFWERSAERWIFSLPPVGQLQAVWSFMVSQGKAFGLTMEPPPGIKRWLPEAGSKGESVEGSPTAT